MNLYLISQKINDEYDTYDSAVVAAESAAEAKGIIPHKGFPYTEGARQRVWADHEYVSVKLIGYMTGSYSCKSGDVICASFNAG